MRTIKNFWPALALLSLALAIALLVVGVRCGQDFEVFQKAARICLECIGIG